jgi:hypothetical protein
MSFAAILSSMNGFLGACLLDDAGNGNTKIIQIVSGILAVVILVVVIQRRRTRVK